MQEFQYDRDPDTLLEAQAHYNETHGLETKTSKQAKFSKTGDLKELSKWSIKKIADDPRGYRNAVIRLAKRKAEEEFPNDEKKITVELKAKQKISKEQSSELTTRLRYSIVSVDGDDKKATINAFSQNMLARDSMFLREEMKRVSPDIEMQQTVDVEGDSVVVDIPMTANFFWPSFGK